MADGSWFMVHGKTFKKNVNSSWLIVHCLTKSVQVISDSVSERKCQLLVSVSVKAFNLH